VWDDRSLIRFRGVGLFGLGWVRRAAADNHRKLDGLAAAMHAQMGD
jgi:hypothetical protein